MFVPAQNVSDSPVLIDAAGRTLGGGDWGPVDRHDPVAQEAIGDSRLAIHPDLVVSGDTSEEARTAVERAEVLERRRRELANLSEDQLTTLANAAGIDVELDDDFDTVEAADTLRRVLVYVDPPPPVEAVAEPDDTGSPVIPAEPKAKHRKEPAQ